MKKFLFFLIFIYSKSLVAIESIATHALIMDYLTGDILYEKNAYEKTPPASMTKIMTSYIIFDLIKNKNLSLDDEFIISKKAYKMGGSRSFVEIDSKVTVKDLLYGVIIQSGNDASVALAENISGTEKEFANLMNKYAIELGMKNTNFINSSGWPHPNHYSTMYDLSVLSKNLIMNFPNLYKIFSKQEYKYNNILQYNRNLLLKYFDGADGLKTGYVKDSGYGIIGSSFKKNRRIIIAINGLESSKSRNSESQRLLNWAYRETNNSIILEKNQILKKADVWLGSKSTVNLVSKEKIIKTLDSEQSENVKIILKYNNPLEAPIKKGDTLGVIKIIIPNMETFETPIVSNENIKKTNILFRPFEAIRYLLFGNI